LNFYSAELRRRHLWDLLSEVGASKCLKGRASHLIRRSGGYARKCCEAKEGNREVSGLDERKQGPRMDGEHQAKDVLRSHVRSTISVSRTGGVSLSELRGVALFDMERDDRIRAVPSVNDAVNMIVHRPHFVERFGTDAAVRIVLQFVYQYFARNHVMSYNDEVFEYLYGDLLRELESPVWTFRGVANVRHFDCDVHPINLGDGITIRGRSQSDLADLGFDAAIWDRIADNWRGFGASSFVLVVEH
jgi:hypothetical protein